MLPLSPFSICNGPWHPLYSTYVLDSPHVQPLSRSSLVFLLVLNPQLHTPYISSPSHRHLFATHDRTSAACSDAVPMLCHLPLVSLSAPYLGIYLFSLTRHIHLTILISAREVPPHFLSLQARSHFHATCCFSHNYCTTFLS